jgi:hypothetical protein
MKINCEVFYDNVYRFAVLEDGRVHRQNILFVLRADMFPKDSIEAVAARKALEQHMINSPDQVYYGVFEDGQ